MATAKKTASSTPRGKTTAAATTPTVETTNDGFRLSLGSVQVNGTGVKDVVTDSAFATLGASDYAIAVARELPQRLETLSRERAQQATDLVKDAPGIVKNAPAKLQGEINDTLASARNEFIDYADRGRKVVKSITQAASTKRAIEQTDTARSQVKGAVTSLRKAVAQSEDAAGVAVGRIGRRRTS